MEDLKDQINGDYLELENDRKIKRSVTTTESSLLTKIWEFLSSSGMADKNKKIKLKETRSDDRPGDHDSHPILSQSETYEPPSIETSKLHLSSTPTTPSDTTDLPTESPDLSSTAGTDRDDIDRAGLLQVASRSHKQPTVTFDRAFMYVVRHNPTGLILHIGRYLDPA